ncbi:response regulator [Desulfovibrio ferrophilus]|uniref:Response regulator receiver protein n=1 Tax=Desulfovibrio ferrophilus TaxID=241368 RepID=A0A2Z6B0P4_9BACT|nr:response regulator [Desulfovibrio ferrophilus]BBD09072.1 response regulator receiver protein [Desulfovibrio ferrophilus]
MTRVLLIDDEHAFVETLAKRLDKRGAKVLKSYSGQEGLDLLVSEDNIDVVILDVKMPGLDGVETLKRIKANHPLVEVIMLTGHGTVETAIDGMREGAFDYLLKPCEMDDLMQKIGEANAHKEKAEARINEAEAQLIVLRRGD